MYYGANIKQRSRIQRYGNKLHSWWVAHSYTHTCTRMWTHIDTRAFENGQSPDIFQPNQIWLDKFTILYQWRNYGVCYEIHREWMFVDIQCNLPAEKRLFNQIIVNRQWCAVSKNKCGHWWKALLPLNIKWGLKWNSQRIALFSKVVLGSYSSGMQDSILNYKIHGLPSSGNPAWYPDN